MVEVMVFLSDNGKPTASRTRTTGEKLVQDNPTCCDRVFRRQCPNLIPDRQTRAPKQQHWSGWLRQTSGTGPRCFSALMACWDYDGASIVDICDDRI